MPLLDHFRPPASDGLPWESFHALWVAALVRRLNRTLPRDRYRAFAQLHLGPQVEADVAEFAAPDAPHANGAVAVAAPVRPAAATIPAVFPAEAAVRITEVRNHLRLVGCVELISPSNKKDARERQAFAAKCAAYLQAGVGLAVIDVVTERRASLHAELLALLGVPDPAPVGEPLYAVGYRPVHRDGRSEIDLWPEPLRVGDPLPAVPLALRGGPVVELDLDGTYAEAVDDGGG